MDWEVINGITGIVSAISGFMGIKHLSTTPSNKQTASIVSTENISKLAVISAGWALCCLCFLLIFEPFGPYMRDRDYLEFYGYVLACPALIIFFSGYNLLFSDKPSSESHK
jgi:hypothetical protein